MQYILLVYADASKRPEYTLEQFQASKQINTAYLAEAQAAGALMHHEGFHPVSNARTVRVRDDKTLTADGPFAETQEQLTGYIMLDCKDLDEAIGWVEVRPVDAYSQ